MPVKLTTTSHKIDKIENVQNRFLVNNITNLWILLVHLKDIRITI